MRRSTTGVGRFKLGETMYRRMLVPLDGSKTAEKVLPYARSLAGKLKIPVEFQLLWETR